MKALAFTPVGPGVLHLDRLYDVVRVAVPSKVSAMSRFGGGLNSSEEFLAVRTFRFEWWQCPIRDMNPDWAGWPEVHCYLPSTGRAPYYRIPIYREEPPCHR